MLVLSFSIGITTGHLSMVVLFLMVYVFDFYFFSGIFVDLSSSFAHWKFLLTKNSFFPCISSLDYSFFFHSTNFLDNIIHSPDFNYNQFAPFMPTLAIGTPKFSWTPYLVACLTSLPLFSSIMGDLTIPLVIQLQMQVSYFSLTTRAYVQNLINQWGFHISHQFWRSILATSFKLLLP